MLMKTISTFPLDIEYIWIYNWNANSQQFYCVPYTQKYENPIAVNLSTNFQQKYNHLVIITKNYEAFQNRIYQLNKNLFPDIRLVRGETIGHLIMRELHYEEIIRGNNRGDVVFVYCTKANELYNLLRLNYYSFFIEAMGTYNNVVQCYFDHMRRITRGNFESRGFFKVINHSNDVEDNVQFVSSNVDDSHFPPYRITSFDIETARLDNKFPYGETKYDRLCSVAFQTVTVTNVSNPSKYTDIENIVFVYIPPTYKYIREFKDFTVIYCSSEEQLLRCCMNYINKPDSIFITGWNIINFDYKFLMKRLIYYDMIPDYMDKKLVYDICSLKQSVCCDIAPPWKLSIDTMESRKRFFPRNLPINPPSNSINLTAKFLLSDNLGKTDIEITKINRVYHQMETINNHSHDDDIDDYMTKLIVYNLRDVELVTKLNAVLQVIQTLVPLSQLADLNPGDCIHYNVTKIGVTYMRNQFQSVIIAPIDYNIVYNNYNDVGLLTKEKKENYYDDDEKIRGKKGTYKGATVLEPVLGIHHNALLGSVDFASLYPNIMLTYGIIRGYVTKMSREEYLSKKNYIDNYFNVLFTPDDSKNVYLSYKKAEITPIFYLCQQLIQKRKLNKKVSPTLANALKILVNSLYGICGVQGVLYDQIAAIMITAYGRYHLIEAKKYFENTFDNLQVLYGDTDSLFLKCPLTSNKTMEQMTNQYNNYLSEQCGLKSLQLSVDGLYECIVFIRKKLYMGKLIDGQGYKLSGFPQRLHPYIFNLMNQSLYDILDIIITEREEKFKPAIQKFYQDLFVKCISGGEDLEKHSYSVKVNPLDFYKNENNKQYYVGNMYEKSTKMKIDEVIYIPVCEVIPLVNKISKKSLTICLKSEFDPKLHILNKTAFLVENLCKTFDPIVKVLLGNDDSFSLKQLSLDYLEKEQNKSIYKYFDNGYYIFNFSDCKFTFNNVKISLYEAWPLFYEKFLQNNDIRGSTDKINWLKEDYPKKKDIFLSIIIKSNTNVNENNLSLVDNICQNVRFNNIREMVEVLRKTVDDVTIMQRLYLKIENRITTLRDMLNLFYFIYNKIPTLFEREKLLHFKDSCDKFLIILPFISIKGTIANYDFTYY